MARLAALRTRMSFQGEPSTREQVPGPVMRIGVGDDGEAAPASATAWRPAAAPRSSRPGRTAARRRGRSPPAAAAAPSCRAWARAPCPSNPRCGTSSTRSRGTKSTIFHGPVPDGAFATASQLLPCFSQLRRGRHHDPGQLVGQGGVGRLGRDFDRQRVDRLVAGHGRNARPALRRLARIELRRVLLQQLVEVPDDGVGRERAAVVEFHAVAQLEHPLGLVGRIDRPGGRQPGHEVGRLGRAARSQLTSAS